MCEHTKRAKNTYRDRQSHKMNHDRTKNEKLFARKYNKQRKQPTGQPIGLPSSLKRHAVNTTKTKHEIHNIMTKQKHEKPSETQHVKKLSIHCENQFF